MIAFETLDGVLTLGKALFDGQTGSALERKKVPGTLVESSRSWNRLGRVGQRSDNGCLACGDRFYNRLCPGVAGFAHHPDAFGSAGGQRPSWYRDEGRLGSCGAQALRAGLGIACVVFRWSRWRPTSKAAVRRFRS